MSPGLLGSPVRRWAAVVIVLFAALVWLRPAGTPYTAAPPADEDAPPPSEPRPVENPRSANPPPPVNATPPAAQAERLDREAMNAWRTGDVRTAMTLFEQAIAAAPDDPAPHSHYGRLLTLMISYERAIPLLERARDLAPQDAQAWLDLATVYERAQRFDDAWAARAEAEKLVGAAAVTRDEQGRFVVVGNAL